MFEAGFQIHRFGLLKPQFTQFVRSNRSGPGSLEFPLAGIHTHTSQINNYFSDLLANTTWKNNINYGECSGPAKVSEERRRTVWLGSGRDEKLIWPVEDPSSASLKMQINFIINRIYKHRMDVGIAILIRRCLSWLSESCLVFGSVLRALSRSKDLRWQSPHYHSLIIFARTAFMRPPNAQVVQNLWKWSVMQFDIISKG